MFRGKQKYNGEWYEGVSIFAENIAFILHDAMIEFVSGFNENKLNFVLQEVIPETVGQYTGLTDKNGKKIFEGDILAFSDRLVYVNWHDYCGCWDCSYIKAIKGKATLHEDRSPDKWRYNAEVVGNIYDNPELLKGGAEE